MHSKIYSFLFLSFRCSIHLRLARTMEGTDFFFFSRSTFLLHCLQRTNTPSSYPFLSIPLLSDLVLFEFVMVAKIHSIIVTLMGIG